MEIGAYIIQTKPRLQAWGDYVSQSITEVFRDALRVPCEPRVKDPVSARAKQLKKNYPNPVVDMTDLVGTRAVVLAQLELRDICSWVENNDAWHARKSRDFEEEIRANPKIFDYQSHHYEIRPARTLRLPQGSVDSSFCCELQVRTLLQHAYAEMVHDNVYKPTGEVPREAERLLARSMALMETTDELFCNAITSIETLNAPVERLVDASLSVTSSPRDASVRDMVRYLAASFRDVLTSEAGSELQAYFDNRPAVLEKVRSRSGGIFDFKAATAAAYWLTSRFETLVLERWPFPSAYSDAQAILSDLGIAAE